MSKQTYFIKLTPLDKYFFGGEVTFGADGAGSNYLVHSNRYPQQTTLLGMLRKELLIQNNLLQDRFQSKALHNNKQKVTNLIGEQGFRLNGKVQVKYGVIEGISPIFLCNEEDVYLKVPSDHGFHFFLLEGNSLTNDPKDYIPTLRKKNDEINWKAYSEKTGLASFLQCVNAADKQVKEEDDFAGVFIPKSQIGIKKNLKGNTEDNAFYKQTFYTLKKGFAFGFYATLSDGSKLKTKDTIVEMGAERSAFRMEAEAIESPKLQFDASVLTGELADNSKDKTKRVVLLSDAYIGEKDPFQYCYFALTDTTPFRFMKTSVAKTSKYYNLRDWDINKSSKEDIPQMSKKYHLLKRGSVLYVKHNELQKVEDILKGFGQFRTIGYNHYQVL